VTIDAHGHRPGASRFAVMEEAMSDFERDVGGTSLRTKSCHRSGNHWLGYCQRTPADMLAYDHG
jgi:hypothetical protein